MAFHHLWKIARDDHFKTGGDGLTNERLLYWWWVAFRVARSSLSSRIAA